MINGVIMVMVMKCMRRTQRFPVPEVKAAPNHVNWFYCGFRFLILVKNDYIMRQSEMGLTVFRV
jgi:hypothetical protein